MYKNAVLLVNVYQAMDSTCIKQCLICVCLSGCGCHIYKILFLLVNVYQDMDARYIKTLYLCRFIRT